jgi:hypothetical protein
MHKVLMLVSKLLLIQVDSEDLQQVVTVLLQIRAADLVEVVILDIMPVPPEVSPYSKGTTVVL